MIEALSRHAYSSVPGWIKGLLKTHGMCDEAVNTVSCSLEFVPDCFKTEGICNEAVHREPYTLKLVPDQRDV